MRLIASALIALVGMIGEARAESPIIALPELTITPANTTLQISGRVIGLKTANIEATLRIEKTDSGGSIDMTQSNDVSVAPGSSDIVGSTQISTQDGLSLRVSLTLRARGAIIGSTTISLGHEPM